MQVKVTSHSDIYNGCLEPVFFVRACVRACMCVCVCTRACVTNLRTACRPRSRSCPSPSRTHTFSAHILVSVHALLPGRGGGVRRAWEGERCGGAGRRIREMGRERSVVEGAGRSRQLSTLRLEMAAYMHTWGGGV
jgi:hypothetical protein